MNAAEAFCIDSSEVSCLKQTNLPAGILASTGMLILIMDGSTALAGARDGIDLCIKTVIPSLFPFFFLSVLLTNSFSTYSFSILKPLAAITGIPAGCEPILFAGFLGGYPAGAQCIASAYSSGHLKKETAERMLSFCNNAGPAFLFGIVGGMFETTAAVFSLWGIHILSALLVAFLTPSIPDISVNSVKFQTSHPDAMRSALRTMGAVCGWVILFRIIISFLDSWFLWLLPTTGQVILKGILELSNGCCSLSEISDPQMRFIVCSGLLSLGGLCVAMQTKSVLSELSILPYLKGKVLQTLFSVLLSTATVLRAFPVTIVVLIPVIVFLQKRKIKGSNSAAVAV